MGVDRPVFLLLERFDFALTFNNQSQRYGLNASSGESTTNLVPQQRGDLVSNQAVKHATRLLSINQVAIDLPGMLERFSNGALRDFIEGDPLNAQPVFTSFLLLLCLFLAASVARQLFLKVRSDSFAFPVRVRREINRFRRICQLLQLDQNLFFSGDDDVFGIEFIFDVDAQRALGQVLHVPKRSLHGEALSQIFLYGLRLGWRFDDDYTSLQIS